MDDDRHVHDVAHEMVRQHGAYAISVIENRTAAHVAASEPQGADFWRRVAGRVRQILAGTA
jgi:hypothetical protein